MSSHWSQRQTSPPISRMRPWEPHHPEDYAMEDRLRDARKPHGQNAQVLVNCKELDGGRRRSESVVECPDEATGRLVTRVGGRPVELDSFPFKHCHTLGVTEAGLDGCVLVVL